jgi:hypothetical protein
MEIERRQHPRVIVNWPVVVNIPGGSLEGEVKDISIGGVCILCPEEPAHEDNFRILLKPSEQQALSVIGEKVWSDTIDIGYGTVCGIGIRFTYISAVDRQYIAKVVEEERSE